MASNRFYFAWSKRHKTRLDIQASLQGNAEMRMFRAVLHTNYMKGIFEAQTILIYSDD